MTLPVNHPFNDIVHSGWSASIGTTPTAAVVVATKPGRVVGASGVNLGGTAGAVTVTVATAAGTVGTFSVGSTIASAAYIDFGGAADNAAVNPGDTVTCTPSATTGTSIPGLFQVVIR